MSLSDELAGVKTVYTRMRREEMEGWPKGAFEVSDYGDFKNDLEDMEITTRYMPITRLVLDLPDHDLAPIHAQEVAGEIEKLIARLRPRNPWLADHREKRLALFRLKPTTGTLRAIWIRKKPS